MPNTLYVDAGYMTCMRRCWAYVRLVAVRVPRVIRTVRKDRWEVPHAFRVGRIGWMFQMVPLPISTDRSKLWLLTRWWSEGTSRCISTSVRSPIRNPTNGCANSAAAKSIASSSMMMTFSKYCLRSDEKVICLCRVFSLKCPICGSFWHFRKMISVICGSLPRKISSRGGTDWGLLRLETGLVCHI